MAPWVLAEEELAGSVLELGSGSGAMAAEFLERFPTLTLNATDFDPRMVEVARSRLAGFGGRASAEAADATNLHFADASFDGVIAFGMLHHVGQWELAPQKPHAYSSRAASSSPGTSSSSRASSRLSAPPAIQACVP